MTQFEIIREILADVTGIDESDITTETALVEDLGLDSLDQVELIMMLEEEFDIGVPDEEAEKLDTVAEVLNLLNRYDAVSKRQG